VSEFSQSYHVWTEEPDETLKRIRQAGFAGFAFVPKGGWLTLVPFAFAKPCLEPGGALRTLRNAARQPILEFRFAEDQGWTFALHQLGKPVIAYEQWWDPAPLTDDARLETCDLADMVGAVSAQQLERLLASTPAPDNARKFAELLRLPAYKWISPAYAQADPDSFKAMGATMIGRRPKDLVERIDCPRHRAFDYARSDMTALEALAQANALMKPTHPNWFPVRLFAQGWGRVVNAEGRLENGGDWGVEYRQADGPACIQVTLMPWLRKVAFKAGRVDFIGKHPVPAHLLDPRPPEMLPRSVSLNSRPVLR